MLIRGINDADDMIDEVADFLIRLEPSAAYLSIPTRPPAEKWVRPSSEEVINRTFQLLHRKVGRVEYLIGYEGNAFAFTGNVETDLMSITAVHPMREEAVSDFLRRANADWSIVHKLIADGMFVEMDYGGRKFYMRKLHKGPGR